MTHFHYTSGRYSPNIGNFRRTSDRVASIFFKYTFRRFWRGKSEKNNLFSILVLLDAEFNVDYKSVLMYVCSYNTFEDIVII